MIRDAPQRARSVAVIGDETLRVERIVGDLLDLAKLEGGADSLRMAGCLGRGAVRPGRSPAYPARSGKGADVLNGDRPSTATVFTLWLPAARLA